MFQTQFVIGKSRTTYSFLFLLLSIFTLQAQVSPLQFKHLTTANGLSQSTVIVITQDHDDIMWFGTRDGLNKYDGNDFTVFRNNSKDENSISNNDILDIVEDSEGDLWVATYNGLNLFDSKSMKFTRFMNQPKEPSSLSDNAVRSVIQLKNGKILAGTINGLNIIDKESNEIRQIFSDSTNTNSLLDNNIYEIFEDHQGIIWVGAAKGLTRLSTSSGTGDYIFKRFPLEGRVQAITEDASGRIWFGTNKGLFRLNQDDELENFSNLSSTRSILNQDVRALACDDEGHIWVGTYEGISRIDSIGNIHDIQYDPLDPEGLKKNTVKSIYKDKTGSMWVGAYYGGISIWNKANSNFRSIKELANGQGLSYNVVSSIVEDQEMLYFGTEGGGISILNKKTGYFSRMLDDQYWVSGNIKALYLDDLQKEMWVGTFDRGVSIWDKDSKKIKFKLDIESGLSNNSVYDIAPFGESKFWIGTFGGGLNLYDRKDNSVITFRHDTHDKFSLCDDQVRTVLVDSKNNLWAGTQDGLSLLKYDKFSLDNYSMKNFFQDSLSGSGEDILVVFEDKKGTIWVGTKETGLHYFEENDFVHVELFDQSKNMSKTIHSILEDESGVLWISSNNGIIRYDSENEASRLFEESDGLVSNEFNNNSSLKSKDGVLYFGGPEGVSSFIPSQIQGSAYTPKVILTDFKVYNESILPGDSTEILDKNISQMEEIKLDYDEAIFTIQFALPSYINPNKNSYAYRLIGLDEKWKLSSVNEASFTIQKAGEYLFEVKGCNSDGVWNDKPTVLSVTVHPAPWRTWWSFLLYGLVISTALYFLLKMRQSSADLKLDLELEHKANEQQQSLNKMKLQFFTNISHEFRTPLTLILGPLQQIINEYRGSNTLFKQLIVIQQNANQLLKLINQLMEFRKLENKQAQLKAAEGNIVKFTKEIFLSFRPYAKSEGYEYEFFSEKDKIMIYYDRDKMERVIYNLISNAFKYTTERKYIKLEITQEGKTVRIAIVDSGIGMKAENIGNIFERFYQISEEEQSKKETAKGTGIGLALTKGIIDLHKGNIEVQSEYGQGSTFTISLPVGDTHLSPDQMIENFKDSEDVSTYSQQTMVTTDVVDVNKLEIALAEQDRKSILVVEDNKQVREFIVSLLDSNIYQVSEASNGKEGLGVAIEDSPDLIISDVMMPEMDGIELCSLIKSNIKTSHIPIILLTARTSLIFKYEGLESGADDYINKPFNIKELQLKVKNLLAVMETLKAKFKTSDMLSPSEVTISSIDEELLKKAIEIVDQNISNEFFDVPFFCSELGVSRTMLFTKVKVWTNMTPNDFIQSMRMKRAAQLLEKGKINVSQVCFNVGYKNPKYFSKKFQKHYSMTPTEYANKFKVSSLED